MILSGISFVIPAFNEEVLLPDCLKSITAEIDRWHKFVDNSTQFEIIVVDNNSTDNTAEIAKSYGATVIFEIKKGLTQARQAGYNAAKYDYHAYIDADNELPNGWLNNIEYLNDSNVVAISGPPYYKDQKVITKTSVEVFYFLTRMAHKYIGPSMQGGNFIVKKQALDLVNGHSTNILFYGEDTDLAVRLSKVGKIKLLPSMWIYSSDRRYANQGILTTTFIYTLNYFSINFFRKPITKTYKDFREEDKQNA